MIAKIAVANAIRKPEDRLGPSWGTEIRVSMNEAPHKDDNNTSWIKYFLFTYELLSLRRAGFVKRQ